MANAETIILPDWNAFIGAIWCQRPVVINTATNAPFLDAEEVFAAAKLAVQHSRGGERIDVRLFVDQAIRVVDRAALLPAQSDKDVTAWSARLRATLAGKSFCLVLRELHMYCPKAWHEMRGFFLPLYRCLGVPDDTVNSLFLGEYDQTPFGVHTDPDHTFYFLLEGRKRFWIWPPDYPERAGTNWVLEGGLGSTEFDGHRSNAVVLDAGIGDVVYWPPGFWHVAEGPREKAVALSVGIPAPAPLFVVGVVNDWLGHALGEAPMRLHAMEDNMPTSVQQQFDSLKALLADPRCLARLAWAKHLSSLGFKRLPKTRPGITLLDADILIAAPDSVRWFQTSEAELICLSHGYHLALPNARSILRLLAMLRNGGQWLVGAFVEAHTSDELSPVGVRNILDKLYQMRAIEMER
ncbi:MAG: hypothetical protein IAE88_05190 [Rhodobacteraceae bacterium]|nr:hypothetical protein [Paracoccaceae bacterium]